MRRADKNNIKKDQQQFFYGLAVLLFLLMIGIGLFLVSPLTSFYWLTGIALGYILQRSRFCFTASFRDPYLTGSTALAQAVLLALLVTSIGFAGVKYIFLVNGQVIPGQDYIQAIGLNTIVGGLIFGIGMVIASGCASGLFMRIGEGFQIQLITLLFFFLGYLLGTLHLKWWQKNFVFIPEGIFLPDVLSWPLALLGQLLVIAMLYYIAIKWEKNHED